MRVSKPWLWIGFLILIALNVQFLSRVKSQPEPTPPLAVDISGGHPASRLEIDDYIDRVRRENIEQTIENLQLTEPIVLHADMWQNDPVVEGEFQRCIADRRIARIYEELKQRKNSESNGVVKQAYAKSFGRYKKDITRGLDEWEAKGSVSEPVMLSQNFRSLSASVFLLAAFGTNNEVVTAIEDWQSIGDAALIRVASNPKLEILTSEIGSFGPPQPLFVLNIYLWRLLDRCGYASPADLLEGLTARPLVTEEIPFVAWDGHTNFYDITHQRGGVPIDEKRILRQLTVCRSWLPGAVFSREEKDLIIRQLRAKVMTCSNSGSE